VASGCRRPVCECRRSACRRYGGRYEVDQAGSLAGAVAVGVGVGSWLGSVSVGVGVGVGVGVDRVCEGRGIGDSDELVGVGVGEFLDVGSGVTGQVATLAIVPGGAADVDDVDGADDVDDVDGAAGVDGVAGGGGVAVLTLAAAGALVACLVAEVAGDSLVGVRLGLVVVTTGPGVGAQLVLDEECGPAAGAFPVAVAVLPWLGCPPLGVVRSAEGVPPLACVPSPSVPALLRGCPPSPFSEVLACRIAWRNG
jgi:hypothetical protein